VTLYTKIYNYCTIIRNQNASSS